jgi:hypothetical protein
MRWLRCTVACAAVLAGCGGHQETTQHAATPSPRALDFTGRPEGVSGAIPGPGLGLTRRVPARVRASCLRVSRQTRVRVVCPRLVPRTPLSHIPYSQQPAEVERDLYVLSFNNGTIRGTLHWMTGAGTVTAVNADLIDDRLNETPGLPTRIRLLRSGRTRIAVYRYPRNGGGFQEGHEAAFAEAGGQVMFVSLHGYGHARAATAMLLDLLRR